MTSARWNSAEEPVRTGAPPANCAAPDTGTLLCEIALPADWMAASAAGVKAKSGTWQGSDFCYIFSGPFLGRAIIRPPQSDFLSIRIGWHLHQIAGI